jgi:hypothetical protein
MTLRFFAAAIAIISSAGVNAGAQAKPDFSGKWVMVDSPAPPPAAAADAGAAGGRGGRGGGGRGAGFQPGFGPEFTVKQDATMLTITRGGQTSPLVYKLDGSESKNTVTRDGQQQEQIATATWDGNKLVIATQVRFQGNTREQRRVLAMEGANLVIDQTNPGRGGGASIKVVYKKN